ncbi:MAG: hypothetical protein RLZZ436_309, partial [Planctomycetota bacterium]
HSVDEPADRLSDPHATAAHAHPRASREPGFKLQFKPWHWPHGTMIVAFRSAKGTSTLRRAKVDERRQPSRSIDVSHASKNPSAAGEDAAGPIRNASHGRQMPQNMTGGGVAFWDFGRAPADCDPHGQSSVVQSAIFRPGTFSKSLVFRVSNSASRLRQIAAIFRSIVPTRRRWRRKSSKRLAASSVKSAMGTEQ